MKPFKDKVVVVTGGASGIGAAICAKFGNEGAKIGILDFDKKNLALMEKKLRDAGIDAYGRFCDVTSQQQCDTAIKAILTRFGGIDILVNNAGITQRSTFLNTDLAVYRRIMDVNFFGTLHCTKPALHSLIERKGMIIVTTSIAGIAPLYGRTGYSASKHALHGFFESLRTELADNGVHVMMLCPGFTVTNLQSRALDGKGRLNKDERSMVGKQVSPESVADAVYEGAIKRKPSLILTPVGKLTWIITRIAPSLYEKQMAKKIKPEFVKNN